jgi:ABC-2 type transport system permease protein
MRKLSRYFKIWWLMSRNSFEAVLYSKLSVGIFLTGKILRFVFFTLFLVFLVKGTSTLAGYTETQVVFFFLTFNLIDVLAQFLFREVYRFRPLVVSGDLDLVLVKPVNVLFRVLMGGADVIDLITIPPLIIAVYYVARLLSPSMLHATFCLLLILNGLLIATAFHIAVLGLGIITFEVDHTIMIYRDLVSLGRFPVDIYKEPIRSVLTYLIPVGIMVTLPAKALMGLASFWGIFASFVLGVVGIFLATRFWNFALKRYSSASS